MNSLNCDSSMHTLAKTVRTALQSKNHNSYGLCISPYLCWIFSEKPLCFSSTKLF